MEPIVDLHVRDMHCAPAGLEQVMLQLEGTKVRKVHGMSAVYKRRTVAASFPTVAQYGRAACALQLLEEMGVLPGDAPPARTANPSKARKAPRMQTFSAILGRKRLSKVRGDFMPPDDQTTHAVT
jgi:hypothetical protein